MEVLWPRKSDVGSGATVGVEAMQVHSHCLAWVRGGKPLNIAPLKPFTSALHCAQVL